MATKQEMQDETDALQGAFNEDAPPASTGEDDGGFGMIPDAPEVPGEEAPAGESQAGNVDEGGASGPSVAIVLPDPVAAGNVPPPEGEAMSQAPGEAAVSPGSESPPSEEAAEAPVEQAAEDENSETWKQRYQTLKGKYDAEVKGGRAEEGVGADEAEQIISADFGPEFVSHIKAIARAEAAKASGESLAQMGQTVESIIADINDNKARAHFKEIFDAHPDFMDIGDSPAFAEWLSTNPDQKDVVEAGSAQQIIAMISKFKADTAPPAAAEPAEDIDAAEGVRSSGMRLPEAPQRSQEYADSWDQF